MPKSRKKTSKNWGKLIDKVYEKRPHWRPSVFRPKKGQSAFTSYFESDKWKDRRSLILRYWRHRCFANPEAYAEHVHHITYLRFKDELPMDLIPLSIAIHEKIHSAYGENALEKTKTVLGADVVSNYRAHMSRLTWDQIRQQVGIARPSKQTFPAMPFRPPIPQESKATNIPVITQKPRKQWFTPQERNYQKIADQRWGIGSQRGV